MGRIEHVHDCRVQRGGGTRAGFGRVIISEQKGARDRRSAIAKRAVRVERTFWKKVGKVRGPQRLQNRED